MIKMQNLLIFGLVGIPYSCLLVGGSYGLLKGSIRLYPVLKRISLSENTGQVKQEVQRYIPRGSSIVRAKKIMELNNFKCIFVENSTDYYLNRKVDTEKMMSPQPERANYLNCELSQGSFTTNTTRFHTHIEYKAQKVTDIYVSKYEDRID